MAALDSIVGAPTSMAAIVGFLGSGPTQAPVALRSWQDFERAFGPLDVAFPTSYAVHCFFANGGRQALVLRVERGARPAVEALLGSSPDSGLQALREEDDFNLLCVPDTFDLSDSDAVVVAQAAIALCEARRAVYLVDAPRGRQFEDIVEWVDRLPTSRNAAVYFPAICTADPVDNSQTRTLAPSGAVAGVVARTDSNFGVWKAPAGVEASLNGVRGLASAITDPQNGVLNSQRVNALRSFSGRGHVVWGTRTLAGADTQGDPFKYIPVRRLQLHIERSLLMGTQWAVFERNEEALWAQLRLQVTDFMQTLFRNGAFQGNSARDAYYVRCGAETTSQADVQAGVLNIEIGFAPLRPAEFQVMVLQLALAGE